jgi:hypothetical protein
MRTRTARIAVSGCDTEGAASDLQDREANPPSPIGKDAELRTQNPEAGIQKLGTRN